jgi:hypothetical protein
MDYYKTMSRIPPLSIALYLVLLAPLIGWRAAVEGAPLPCLTLTPASCSSRAWAPPSAGRRAGLGNIERGFLPPACHPFLHNPSPVFFLAAISPIVCRRLSLVTFHHHGLLETLFPAPAVATRALRVCSD